MDDPPKANSSKPSGQNRIAAAIDRAALQSESLYESLQHIASLIQATATLAFAVDDQGEIAVRCVWSARHESSHHKGQKIGYPLAAAPDQLKVDNVCARVWADIPIVLQEAIAEDNSHQGPVVVYPVIEDGIQIGGLAFAFAYGAYNDSTLDRHLSSFAYICHAAAGTEHEIVAERILSGIAEPLSDLDQLDPSKLKSVLRELCSHLGFDTLVLAMRRDSGIEWIGDGMPDGIPGPSPASIDSVAERWSDLASDGMYDWTESDARTDDSVAALFPTDRCGKVVAVGPVGQPIASVIAIAPTPALFRSAEQKLARVSRMFRTFVQRKLLAEGLERQAELRALRTRASELFLSNGELDPVEVMREVLTRVAVTFDADEVVWGGRFDPTVRKLSFRYRRSDGGCHELPEQRLLVVDHPLDPTTPIIRTRFDASSLAWLGVDSEVYPDNELTVVTLASGSQTNAGLGLLDYSPRRERAPDDFAILADLTRLIHQYQRGREQHDTVERGRRYDKLRLDVADHLIANGVDSVQELVLPVLELVGHAFGADYVVFQGVSAAEDSDWIGWATKEGSVVADHLEKNDPERLIIREWFDHSDAGRTHVVADHDLSERAQAILIDGGVDVVDILGIPLGGGASRTTIAMAGFRRTGWGLAEHSTLVSLGAHLKTTVDVAQNRFARLTRRRMDDLMARVASTLIEETDFSQALDLVLHDVVQTLGARAAQWLEADPVERTIDVRCGVEPGAEVTSVPTAVLTQTEWQQAWATMPRAKFCDRDSEQLRYLRSRFPEDDWLPRVYAPVRTRDGQPVAILDVTIDEPAPLDDVLAALSAIGHLLHEVSDRHRADRLLATTFESAPSGQLLLDHAGRIRASNSAMRERFGDLVGTNWIDIDPLFVGGDDAREVQLSVGRHTVWTRVRSAVIDPSQARPTTVIHVEDITAERSARTMLEFDARHDQLTGLGNRRLLDEQIVATTAGSSCTVVMVDLDRFKVVNDSLGHAAGDEVLASVSARLSQTCRSGDVVCRFGGDEFAILLPGELDHHVLVALAHRILELIRQPIEVHGVTIIMTGSVGIASGQAGTDSDTLLRQGDSALHDAKAQGRDRYSFFEPGRVELLKQRLTIETSLRAGLDNNEFVPYFQPEYDLRTGEILSLEALVRWCPTPDRVVEACDFIDIAEEIGLAPVMSQLVLEHSCAHMIEWRELGLDARVRVNVTAAQLRSGSLDLEVHSVLSEHGIRPDQLCLEVTERSLLLDLDATIATLAGLREAGVEIAIDDFGTGFSSLSWLKRLPIDTLKIDRTFVLDIAKDRADREIAKTIIGLADALDLNVVAEGVEHQSQADVLLDLGCARAQGWLWSPAVDPEKVPALFSSVQQ